nr:MAG TPA: hypothetical protein [Caudoviricetes sp.]
MHSIQKSEFIEILCSKILTFRDFSVTIISERR